MILELKNIEKSFGEKKVLTGVSFKAEGGKAFGLLGRNGAGKTTSIRILMDRRCLAGTISAEQSEGFSALSFE